MPKYDPPQEGVSIAQEKGGKVAPAGVWVHPETGNRAITLEDPLFGSAQSQAFLQAGFQFERPAQPEEIVTLPAVAIAEHNAQSDSMKGLSARLDQLEGVAEKNKALEEEVAQLRKEKEERNMADAEVASKKAAKPEDSSDETEVSLSKQNATQLKA